MFLPEKFCKLSQKLSHNLDLLDYTTSSFDIKNVMKVEKYLTKIYNAKQNIFKPLSEILLCHKFYLFGL